jgi:hypothetical protein
MAFAIMRCAKKSSMGAVARSLKHCFREVPTPNADPDKTAENKHGRAGSTDEAMGRLRELLPEKRRKDAVVCVEYLMTASPEWWKDASDKQQSEFFNRSFTWLAEKYGRENILVATVHNDETTPHLSAFVVPLTADKRLSAKEFIGNKAKMSQDQTSYAERVQDLGLQRGVKGSRARHETIRQYYGRVNAQNALKTPEIDVPEPKMLEAKPDYGRRVAESVLQQISPELLANRAKATERDTAAKRADELNKLVVRQEAELKALKKPYEGLPKELVQRLHQQTEANVQKVRELLAEKLKQKREQEVQQRPSRGISR